MERSAPSGRRHTHHRRSTTHGVFVYGASALLGLAILLGGGTKVGLNSDVLLQLLSLPMLAIGVWRIGDMGIVSAWRLPIVILCCALLLPLLQLVPLPPGLWTHLPGREPFAATFATLGVSLPWQPYSLSPHATVYAFFSLLPAISLFIAALTLDDRERYALLIGPMLLVAASVLIGLAQQFTSAGGVMALFDTAHAGYAIGFFANRNHFAALLYSMLPLAVAWTLHAAGQQQRRRSIWIALGSIVIALLLVGLSVAFSRAGVTLGVLAAFGSLLLAWRSRSATIVGKRTILAAGVVLLLFGILLQLGLIDLLLQRSAVDLQREWLVAVTLRAIEAFNVVGSGFGTFVPVYMMFEAPGEIGTAYANHAHNDWLELVLEGGILAVALLALFLYWLLPRIWSAWIREAEFSQNGRMLARAASLSVVLLLVHSSLDYPLRTTALMSVFAVCCGFLIAGRADQDGVSLHRVENSAA